MNYDGLLTFLPKASNLFDLICFYFCTSVVLPCLVAIFFIGGTLLFEEVNTLVADYSLKIILFYLV